MRRQSQATLIGSIANGTWIFTHTFASSGGYRILFGRPPGHSCSSRPFSPSGHSVDSAKDRPSVPILLIPPRQTPSLPNLLVVGRRATLHATDNVEVRDQIGCDRMGVARHVLRPLREWLSCPKVPVGPSIANHTQRSGNVGNERLAREGSTLLPLSTAIPRRLLHALGELQ